jgi:UDP-N-acetylglucosamine--N-acetylmuramyl-(pentapeptide) pyrophosphoryl-undecaprenol N-acetylglucosamine transferase
MTNKTHPPHECPPPLRPIVLVAGGSGGHVFPAIALAEYAQTQSHPVILITDRRGARFLNNDQGLFQHIEILESPRWHNLFAMVQHLKSQYKAWDPIAMIGFGGMMTLAPLFLAKYSKIRCAIHQSDAIIGRANRALRPWMNRIFLGHDIGEYFFNPCIKKHHRYEFIGTPVRKGFLDIVAHRNLEKPLKIVVLGGSQGAKIWSCIMPAAIGMLPESDQRNLSIQHQCPALDCDDLIRAYEKLALSKYQVTPFFSNMPETLNSAHVIFSRAGASTLAELSLCKRPVFLVPYPHAAQNHQWANAQSYLKNHDGWVFDEPTLTAPQVATALKSWLDKPDQLLYGQQNRKKISNQDASSRLYDFCTNT